MGSGIGSFTVTIVPFSSSCGTRKAKKYEALVVNSGTIVELSTGGASEEESFEFTLIGAAARLFSNSLIIFSIWALKSSVVVSTVVVSGGIVSASGIHAETGDCVVVVVVGIGVVVLRESDLPISFMKKTCILAPNDSDFSVVVVTGASVVVVGMYDA